MLLKCAIRFAISLVRISEFLYANFSSIYVYVNASRQKLARPLTSSQSCCPQERPFPDDETLQRSLQDKVNWEAYKRKTMKSLVRALPTARRREISLQNHLKSKRDMSLSQDLKDALKRMKKGPDEG